MSLTSRRVPRVLLILFLWLGAAAAWAQHADMTLYVFKDGLPRQWVEVLVDGEVIGATDENGVVRLEIPAGVRRLEVRDQDLVVLDQQVLANDGELSQWIVNITQGLSSLVDVESSAGGAAAAVAVAAQAAEADAGPGTLSGVLTSADDGAPVAGARIFLSGQGRDIRTADDGRFEVEVPAGTYSLSVLHAAHNTLTEDGIEVREGEETTLALELTPSGSELPEFVVIEPYIAGSLASVLEERRTEVAVANILGAEQISKAGDSDAAGALRRVTGLTLVDGRFIYVRGLGERYSSTLLNNANVPSPDPTRRVVPLDLFPTGIIDSIAVKKGYTTDLPGEFGGGTVELRTKSVPEETFFTVELGIGYREGTSFEDGLRYDGGSKDWTGYDSGIRQQSEELSDAIGDGTRLEPANPFLGGGFPPEELAVIGQSLPVIYDSYDESLNPNLDASLAGGAVWEFGNDVRFGFLGALEWKDEWLNVEQRRTQYVIGGGELRPQNDFDFRQTFRNINFSAFFTTGLEIGENHELSFNWMLLRNSTDRAQVEQGFNVDSEGGDVRFTELEWTEREMKARQLLGEHLFPTAGGLKVSWQWTDAIARSDIPDNRRYRFDPDRRTPEEDDFIFSLRNDSNQRRWSELDDDSRSWNLDFLHPFEITDSVDFGLKYGFNKVDKFRDASIRRFAFICRGSPCRDLDLLRNPSVEDIIYDETIQPGAWQLEEVTNATDTYTGTQEIDAFHVGLDFNFGETLRLAFGIRDEQSNLAATTFNLFDPGRIPIVTEQKTDDQFMFTSATLFLGDHQFRAGYAETTNRPDFKEISPSQYRDPLLDRIVQGNPDLEPAYITHYDLRWDYYFNPGEFISLGVFYKEFDQPIEFVILPSGGTFITSFANAETAENFGAEFELYKSFEFLNDWWGWGEIWGNFYVNTNYAWIDSEITLSDDNTSVQTSSQRPLQGQSPYVWNFQIGYDDLDRDINAALLYNVFGERIVEVGAFGAPDTYEQPRPSLDFVYSQGFGDWKLKAKARNLLDPEIELTQGTETARLTRPVGREYSIAVEYTFR